MPLFGHKRPPLDGLTKDEEKRRDGLNEEITRVTAGLDAPAQGAAVIEALKAKSSSDKTDYLWPLLLGWQLLGTRHFADAIDAFNEASKRESDVRCLAGAGSAYMRAGDASTSLGIGVTDAMVPANMTGEQLYNEAERCFASAISHTNDKDELVLLNKAKSAVDVAVARSVKRPV